MKFCLEDSYMSIKSKLFGLVACAGALAMSSPAKADTILLVHTGTAQAGIVNTYNYNVFLTNDRGVQQGAPQSMFTAFDISKYVDNTAQFTRAAVISLDAGGDAFGNFVVDDSQFSSPTYSGYANDDAAYVNLSGFYIGADYENESGSNVYLGTFRFSSLAKPGEIDVASLDVPLSGGTNPSIYQTTGPQVQPGGPQVITPTPVAASAGLALISLLGVGRSRRVRK
jgi:hypothetical protein